MASPSPSKKPKTDGNVQDFINSTNSAYEELHLAFEEQFWGTKMNLGGGSFSVEKLSATKEAMEAMLRDPSQLAKAEALLAGDPQTGQKIVVSPDQRQVLECFVRTFKCYQMRDPEAVELRNQANAVENALNEQRNKTFKLGYRPPTTTEGATPSGATPSGATPSSAAASDAQGGLVEKSSVQLRTLMRTSDDEATRRAAWEGLRSIGPFVLGNGLCEMVKLRNTLAKKLGYEDFYDYKVTQAEGFGKHELFKILDTLKAGSDPLLAAARAQLQEAKGEASLEPWNLGWAMAGDAESALDPYFPFEKSLEVWGRCFSKLGIDYKGATMTLDLLDRKGKYSNGFCHWPQPAWRRPDGSWQPSSANFTSLADPAAVGSGKTALTTLMHEAGHAAHFANIDMPSPLFSQERAPTSVAYAENQSMFLDSLVGDAAWRAKYARNRLGEAVPWAVHEQGLRATHPFEVFQLRGMLAVPYFEKALYELPEDQVRPEVLAALADEVERALQGSLASRPLLCVPHIISDEASCYYHGYVLAEMSVHQTRAYFLASEGGSIVDNPNVGKVLTEAYWKPGNSAQFLDLVKGLTGKPLTGDAWIDSLKEDLGAKISSEKAAYEASLAQRPSKEEEEVDLKMRVVIKDGDEVIADSEPDGFLAACATFEAYVRNRFPTRE